MRALFYVLVILVILSVAVAPVVAGLVRVEPRGVSASAVTAVRIGRSYLSPPGTRYSPSFMPKMYMVYGTYLYPWGRLRIAYSSDPYLLPYVITSYGGRRYVLLIATSLDAGDMETLYLDMYLVDLGGRGVVDNKTLVIGNVTPLRYEGGEWLILYKYYVEKISIYTYNIGFTFFVSNTTRPLLYMLTVSLRGRIRVLSQEYHMDTLYLDKKLGLLVKYNSSGITMYYRGRTYRYSINTTYRFIIDMYTETFDDTFTAVFILNTAELLVVALNTSSGEARFLLTGYDSPMVFPVPPMFNSGNPLFLNATRLYVFLDQAIVVIDLANGSLAGQINMYPDYDQYIPLINGNRLRVIGIRRDRRERPILDYAAVYHDNLSIYTSIYVQNITGFLYDMILLPSLGSYSVSGDYTYVFIPAIIVANKYIRLGVADILLENTSIKDIEVLYYHCITPSSVGNGTAYFIYTPLLASTRDIPVAYLYGGFPDNTSYVLNIYILRRETLMALPEPPLLPTLLLSVALIPIIHRVHRECSGRGGHT